MLATHIRLEWPFLSLSVRVILYGKPTLINDRESVHLKHGSILLVTNPPGQPPGQVQPFGPGGGELLKYCCLGGRGRGKSKITFPWFCAVRVISRAVCTMESFFDGKTQEFVLKWREMNKLSKLKSLFWGYVLKFQMCSEDVSFRCFTEINIAVKKMQTQKM